MKKKIPKTWAAVGKLKNWGRVLDANALLALLRSPKKRLCFKCLLVRKTIWETPCLSSAAYASSFCTVMPAGCELLKFSIMQNIITSNLWLLKPHQPQRNLNNRASPQPPLHQIAPIFISWAFYPKKNNPTVYFTNILLPFSQRTKTAQLQAGYPKKRNSAFMYLYICVCMYARNFAYLLVYIFL